MGGLALFPGEKGGAELVCAGKQQGRVLFIRIPHSQLTPLLELSLQEGRVAGRTAVCMQYVELCVKPHQQAVGYAQAEKARVYQWPQVVRHAPKLARQVAQHLTTKGRQLR